jgi:maltose O-acetyltransferase
MFGFRRFLLRLAGLDLRDGVCVCGGGWFFGRGRISFGERTWLSPGVRIYSHGDAPVQIGADCDIGPEVVILTGSHEIGERGRRAGPGTAAPVTIADGCWIGARALILGGVTIGPGSVIAAGSVVVSDVPENVLAAGVPARTRRALH